MATTTKAVALMSMPGTALSMLGATIMPTITTTPLWLLWLSWPLLSLPMGGALGGALDSVRVLVGGGTGPG